MVSVCRDVCVTFFGHGVGISVVFVPTFGTVPIRTSSGLVRLVAFSQLCLLKAKTH
jgi:hypothetical protein